MDKNDLIRRALAGERPERVPYGFWTHLPDVDLVPELLAQGTYELYLKQDLAFIKTMSNGMFSIEDWGCRCDFSSIATGGVAKVLDYAVNEASDWEKIAALDVEKGALGRELTSIRLLAGKTGGSVPIVATVFSPLTTAQKMCRGDLARYVRESPEALRRALAVIARTTGEFAARAVDLGCAGVYFAMQSATTKSFTSGEYAEFGVPYDLEALAPVAARSWFNIAHIHGDDILFDLVKDYPVQGISWHVWETAPSPAEFQAIAPGKTIVGGLQRFHITDGNRQELKKQVADMMEITGGRRLVLAPGCVIRAPFDQGCLDFVRAEISKYSA